jgi:hypothetical protein
MSSSHPHVGGNAGFTVVELLVATAITLVIMGGTLVAFTHAMRANEAAVLSLGMNGSLETAIDLMVRDFTQVGQGLPSTKVIAIPSGTGAGAVIRPGPPGTNYTFPAGATEMAAVTPGAGLGGLVNGAATDMITVVYADSLFDPLLCNTTPAGACTIAADGASMAFTSNTLIADGDVIMFANGTAPGSAAQMVTGHGGSLPNQTIQFGARDALNLNQRGASIAGNVLDIQTSPGVFPPTTVSRIRMLSYFLDATADPPRLMRRINAEPARTVAFGIESLQFSYDLVNGLTNPTDVKMNATDLAGGGACGAAPCSPNQIRKANLFLAARSRGRYTATQQFFRNTLVTQVSLRSLAFVDRYR